MNLTDKQQDILNRLNEVIEANKIKIYIDKCSPAAAYDSLTSCDIEHNEQGEMVCIGLYNGAYAECWTRITPDLKRFLENAEFVGHNFISDMEMLRQWGVNIRDEQLCHDTMLFGHILDSSKKTYGLKDMAKRELGITYPDYDEIVGKHKGKTKKAPACNKQLSDCCGRMTLDKQMDIAIPYNVLDTFVTYKLYEKQMKEAKSYVRPG